MLSSLDIAVDGVVRAQGWLKGHVEIETKERVPIISSDGQQEQVIVELVGKETVCSLSHNTQSEQVVFEERSIHKIIMDDKDFLDPGIVHEFPFSLYLPGTIPPSILYKDKVHLEGCSVKYNLMAQFASSTYAQELSIVGAPLSNKAYPAQVGPTVLPLAKPASSSSWMPTALLTNADSGSIILAAKVGNTHIGKGQALKFSIAVRNRSRNVDIESIQATIVERIDWDIGGGDKNVAKKRCDSTCLASVNCAGIPTLHFKKQNDASASSPSKTAVQVDDVLSSEMHGEMASPRNMLELKIPLNARDSYAGKLIQVSHHLVITAIMATTTAPSSTDAAAPSCHVEIPIKVFDPPVESHSHSLSATSATLDSKAVHRATTVWPNDTVVVPTHLNQSRDSSCSCLSIHEEPLPKTV